MCVEKIMHVCTHYLCDVPGDEALLLAPSSWWSVGKEAASDVHVKSVHNMGETCSKSICIHR